MKTKRYLVRYYHDGQWWNLPLDAYGDEDAAARCRKLSMQCDGPIMLTVPGWMPFAPFIANVICGIRNFFHNLMKIPPS